MFVAAAGRSRQSCGSFDLSSFKFGSFDRSSCFVRIFDGNVDHV
jgi:hypothetical protein